MGRLPLALLAWGLALSCLVAQVPAPAPFPDTPLLPPDLLPPNALPPEDPSAFLVDATLFAWAPRRANQDFVFRAASTPTGVVGTVRSLDGGYDPGFRIAVGYRFDADRDARVAYTRWNHGAHAAEQARGDERLFPTLTHPALIIEADSVRAASSLNMHVLDLELARRYGLGEGIQTRVFFGPRLTQLDQKLTATHEGGDVAVDVVRRRVKFDGGGLRLGGDADLALLDNLGMFVRGSAGVVAGRFRSSLEESVNGLGMLQLSDRLNRTVPMADLGFGVTYQRGGMRLSVGYEFHNWFGVVDGLEFSEDTYPAKPGRRMGDLGFDGVFFRAELQF
jgi:hypothetical protein